MTDICSLSLTAVAEALQKKELSAAQVTLACLERMAATEPQIAAMLAVDAEGARSRAAELDQQGPDPSLPLWGVPLTLKDALSTKGLVTTAGSRILEGFRPVYDAFVVEKLRAGGAVILGKANLDEFAMGSGTGEFGLPKNPQSVEHGPRRRAAPPAVPPLPWPPGNALPPWEPIPAAPSASRPRSAAVWASSPPTAGCRAMADRLRLVPGSNRTSGPQRGRLRPHAFRDCRARPARRHQRPAPAAGLYNGPDPFRSQGRAPGPAQRIFRRRSGPRSARSLRRGPEKRARAGSGTG